MHRAHAVCLRAATCTCTAAGWGARTWRRLRIDRILKLKLTASNCKIVAIDRERTHTTDLSSKELGSLRIILRCKPARRPSRDFVAAVVF